MSLVPCASRSAYAQVSSQHSTDVAIRERLGEPEWYLPTEANDRCRLFVREIGTGSDTVIVVHGGFGAEHSYLLNAFAGQWQRHHFVFYDQRGSLRSQCPDSLVSFQKHVDDLERLRAALGLKHPTLVAHSMGTLIAMAYLEQHPNSAGDVVLLGAAVPWLPRTPADSLAAAASDTAFSAWSTRAEVAAQLHSMHLDGPPEFLTPKQAMDRFRVPFAAANIVHLERFKSVQGGLNLYNGSAGNAAYQTLPPGYDFRPALRSRSCPTWVIDGDHDLLDMGALRHAAWTRETPRAHLVVLADAGHDAWVDAPAHFAEALRRALLSSAECH